MNHLGDEGLVELCYEAAEADCLAHLEECCACRDRRAAMKEMLDSWRAYPVPLRGDGYGPEVWARLEPKLSGSKRGWRRWWYLAPALAAMLVIAFLGGIWTEQRRATTELKNARERVLLIALSDHLERSQVVLTELLHTGAHAADLADERERARRLLDQNRLLRATALHLGDRPDAALLDDLERVLLSLANSPAGASADEFKELQERVESGGLLWRMRITSGNTRQKGWKL